MKLSKSQFVVVLVIQDVHEISIERVNLVNLWKLGQNCSQTIVPIALRVFHFAHIELPDSLDGPTCTRQGLQGHPTQNRDRISNQRTIVNDSRSLSLSFRQYYINKVTRRRHRLNAFEVVQRHAEQTIEIQKLHKERLIWIPIFLKYYKEFKISTGGQLQSEEGEWSVWSCTLATTQMYGLLRIVA